MAPEGTLATLNGMAGGAHFGFGKGVGGLLGGVLKDQLQSMAMAFRVFSIGGFASAFLYALYYYTWGIRQQQNKKEVNLEMVQGK